MCEDKPYRDDCRNSRCSKSNAYIVPNDREADPIPIGPQEPRKSRKDS